VPRRGGKARSPASAIPPLPLRSPATLTVAAIAFACIAFSVTYRIFDPDFWQHLLVGRVIWQTHSIPREHLWSWVSYGKPEPLQSWAFCALLWPFYSAGGVMGLAVWRWLTTLAAFALLWAAARRMGARGLVPLVVLAWCAWIFRVRTQVRPEMVAAVLMALELWVLESRRARRSSPSQEPLWRDPAWALVSIVWVWANAHASYFIAFVLLAIHAGDLALRRGGMREIERLAPVALAMMAIGFANPFGWRTLWLPFDYALHLSRETLFRGISELAPMSWSGNARSGVWLMIFLWPLLALLRVRRAGPDWAELATCALATAYAIPSQRFVGVYALAAAPYLGRDLDELARAWPRPGWLRAPALRAALASAACLAVGIPEALRPTYVPGIGIEMERYPVAAADFMAHHGVRGRGFSHFRQVGYLTWRFWPDRERLPFTDIHQTGTPGDREAFAEAFLAPRQTWSNIAGHYQLDYAVLDRRARLGAELLDVVDADSAWAVVFLDDAAALYVRRAALPAVADSFAFHMIGGGAQRLSAIAHIDSAGWDPLRAELERSAASSHENATANAVLASMALAQGHNDEARRYLERVLAVTPKNAQARELLNSLGKRGQ
jgi:hypothetical protein